MSRKRFGQHSNSEAPHGDRPWVYFMIDAFFLITQFFVLTFRLKTGDLVLPQKLPPSGKPPDVPLIVQKDLINVHVARDLSGSSPTYSVMGNSLSQAQFTEILSTAAQTRLPENLSVRVSFERDIPFGDVMSVFNACSKHKIAECGLARLR